MRLKSLLGFELGAWDYATFAALAVLVLAGLPGRIAIARKHPAEGEEKPSQP